MHCPRDGANGLIITNDQLHIADIYIFIFTPSTLVNDIKRYAVSLINIVKLEAHCMKIHALKGGSLSPICPFSQSGSPQGWEVIWCSGEDNTPSYLCCCHRQQRKPWLALVTLASGDPGQFCSRHPRLACVLGWPWVPGGLRRLGDSGGRLRILGTAILWLWVPSSLRAE